MTARIRVLPAALLRAGLVAAVLAIVAGILGMHVMTADHSSHAAHGDAGNSVSAQPADRSPGGGHHAGHGAVGPSDSGNSGAGHAATRSGAGASFTASDSCSSGCPGAQEAGASCIPLGKTGSLAVVPPQAVPVAQPQPAAGTKTFAGYSYTPSSPTPCELSISRT